MAINVLSAPGPVCFPLLAIEDGEFNLEFGKTGNAQVVIDSSISLIERKLNIDYVLLSGLNLVAPDFGKKTALMRKGGAADKVAQIIKKREKLETEFIYVEGMDEIMESLKNGKADSAIVMALTGMKGPTLEERSLQSGIYLPGSCGASIENGLEEEFLGIYKKGLDKLKNDKNNSAMLISQKLNGRFKPEFISGIISSMKTVLAPPEDYELIKRELLND